jgi:capsular exopolysaccharide synthesis family protein
VIPSSTSQARESLGRYERTHLEDYWRVVRRRAWLILLTALVALLAATWAASRRPRLYRATLTLQVGDPRGRMGQLGDIDVTPNMLWTDPVESEVQQLTTQAVAQYVADTLQLRAQSPDISRDLLFTGVRIDREAASGEYRIRVGSDGSVVVEPGSGGPEVGGEIGEPIAFSAGALVVRPQVEPGDYRLRVISQLAAEALVRGGLAASTRPETNLIDVTYTGLDQRLVPRILNAVAAALRDLGVRRVRQWARGRTHFIRDQLDESGRELQESLRAVEDYKGRRGLISLTVEESRVMERIATLQSEIERLLTEKSVYTSLVDRIRSVGLRPGDVQQFVVLSTEEVNRTVQFYYDQLLQLLDERSSQLGPLGKDPSHPVIVALDQRISETQNQLVAAAENAAVALDTRISALTGRLSDLQAELRQLPAVESELARLQNEVEIHSDMYKYLLSRHQESQIAEAEISPYVEVLDPAYWARPVSGGRRINIIFGGLLGLLLGVGAAFFLEYLDRSLKSTSDVEASLGVPVLGWIPKIADNGQRRIPLVVVQDPEGIAAEAYRVMRTNIAFSTSRERPLTSLAFTSPGPGEGKSTSVANLAALLADRGDKTLLVDADLRRGTLHESFDLLRSPGLSDLLVGALDPREAIRPAVRPALDLLPAGKRPPNPSELLGSQAMAKLLATWREEYRWMLFDTPPVLAVTDASVLAALVDGAVLVVKAGETDRRAGWQAIQQLRRVDARVVGAVLNEIELQRAADRYYSDYYYSRSSG